MNTNTILALAGLAAGAYVLTRPRRTSMLASPEGASSGRRGRRVVRRADAQTATPVLLDVPSDNPIICAAWKIGNNKPKWGPAEIAQIDDAVQLAQQALWQPWGTLPEAKVLSFEITKAAVAATCPSIPLPADRAELDATYNTQPFWWKRIWDAFAKAAWGNLTAAGGGNP